MLVHFVDPSRRRQRAAPQDEGFINFDFQQKFPHPEEQTEGLRREGSGTSNLRTNYSVDYLNIKGGLNYEFVDEIRKENDSYWVRFWLSQRTC